MVFTTALMLVTQTLVTAAMLGPAVLSPKAAASFGVSPERIGLYVSTVYFVAMGAGLAAGRLVTRWGALRVCQLALLVAAAGLAIGGSGWIIAVFVGAMAIGAAYGIVNPVSASVLARMAPPDMLGFILSIKQTGVPFGGMIAGALLPTLAIAYGWEVALLAVAGACVLLAIACEPARANLDAFIAREPITPIASGGGIVRATIEPIRLVMTVPALREVTLVSVIYSGNQMMIFTFFVGYANLELGHSLVAAGMLFSVVQVAGIVGRIFWGFVGDRTGQPRRVLGVLGVASGVVMLALAASGAQLGLTALIGATFALGAVAIGWNGIYFAEVVRAAPADRVGLATGGAQFFTFLGALVGPALGGLLIAASGRYSTAMMIAAAGALATGLLLLWRKR